MKIKAVITTADDTEKVIVYDPSLNSGHGGIASMSHPIEVNEVRELVAMLEHVIDLFPQRLKAPLA